MIKIIDSYVIECDAKDCDELFIESSSDYSLFGDEVGAEMAFNNNPQDWISDDKEHFCPKHIHELAN